MKMSMSAVDSARQLLSLRLQLNQLFQVDFVPSKAELFQFCRCRSFSVQEYDCSRLSDGLYPFPLINCSQEFFTCSNGYSYKEKCPAHLYFDPQFGVCDSYGNIFACTGQPKRTTTPRTTTVRDEVTTESELITVIIISSLCCPGLL